MQLRVGLRDREADHRLRQAVRVDRADREAHLRLGRRRVHRAVALSMAVSTPDYYAVLGIEVGADDVELRRAWRRLAMQWHPDHAGPEATAHFQELLAAYSVLSDPMSRARYDLGRADLGTGPRRRAPGVMLRRLSGPLNALLTCGVARLADDQVIELFLDDAEIADGGMVTISMRVRILRDGAPVEELFSAWLAIPPEVAAGTILHPTVQLPGMVRPVAFRVRYVTLTE